MAELLGWEPQKQTELSIENKLLSTKRHLKVFNCNWEPIENGYITRLTVKVFWAIHMVAEADVWAVKNSITQCTIQYITVHNTVYNSTQYIIQQYTITDNMAHNTV